MSKPDFGPSENAADNWPCGPPEHIRNAHQLDGATPGDDTRPYEEWHHDSALPGEPGGWDAPQELEPLPEWPGGGTYVPGKDDQPAWDGPYQDQPAQDDPYEPAPYRPSSHRRNLRSARRSIAITALLLATFAACAGTALVHNGTIKLSPTANDRRGDGRLAEPGRVQHVERHDQGRGRESHRPERRGVLEVRGKRSGVRRHRHPLRARRPGLRAQNHSRGRTGPLHTTAAQLTLTPPDGGTISALTIPGYYSPSSSAGLTSATVGYVEQFATYIPAARNSDRQVVADIASIASRGQSRPLTTLAPSR